jgi:RND family efflux transporter MFP subunit
LRWFRCLGLLGALILLAACGRNEDEQVQEVRPVQVMVTDTQLSGRTVTLIGNVQPESESSLSFRIGGRMMERLVGVGDQVRPGQLVAQLDPQDEQSGQQGARAQLSAAQAMAVEADNNFSRMRELVAQDAVSRALFDQAEAGRRATRSQVEAAQAQVRLADNRLGYTRLVSDMAGVVTARGAEPGEVVAAGQMIVQLAREGGRDAVFDVPARIKDNAPGNATLEVMLTSDTTVSTRGQVREIAPRADPITGTFRVKVALQDPPPAMRLGSTVTGRLSVEGVLGIEIPAAAVVRSGSKSAVWVVDPKTHLVAAREIAVQSAGPSTVMVASGLKQGDIVVTAGVQALRPGQKVRPIGLTPGTATEGKPETAP